MTRRITGHPIDPETGQMYTEGDLIITLLRTFVVGSTTVVSRSWRVPIDPVIGIDEQLPVPATGTVPYYFTFPNQKGYSTNLGAGPDTTLEIIIAASTAEGVPQNVVQAAVDAAVGQLNAVDAGLQAQIDGIVSTSTNLITALATIPLSGHRVVWAQNNQAGYASSADSTAEQAAGLTTGAASTGAAVTIQTSGMLVEPSWAWTPGPVFLGVNGTLTQTAPTVGAIVQVGLAQSPTSLFIRIQQPDFLV